MRSVGQSRRNVSDIITRALRQNRLSLLESEARSICLEYGIPTPGFIVAEDVESAVSYAERIGYPVVLKIVSPDILHKTEAGCVLVNIGSREKVRSGYARILKNARRYKSNAKIVGVLEEKMAPQGTEVVVGSIRDQQFGPSIMFGLGGIFVEVLKDITFRIAPITRSEARQMISEIKAYAVLKGYRNQPPGDKKAIADILYNVSRLVTNHPEVAQMDLNPIMVYEKGASVVDARIMISR